ncbi:hypothetical protein PUN28_003962 [Cardiocondyla obscurior]|uniref:Secreted protein n=1 Tax=Cardiocondyla obscurior TaxID=286306 RepID=A0AAW2GNR2_9HYME
MRAPGAALFFLFFSYFFLSSTSGKGITGCIGLIRGERARTRENDGAARLYAFTRALHGVFAPGGNARTCSRNRESERRRRREKEGGEGDRETDRVYVPPEECTRLLVL